MFNRYADVPVVCCECGKKLSNKRVEDLEDMCAGCEKKEDEEDPNHVCDVECGETQYCPYHRNDRSS